MATDTIKECTISYPLCYYHCKQIHPFSQISSENPLSPIDGNNHRDWNCAENKRLSPQLHKDFFFIQYPFPGRIRDHHVRGVVRVTGCGCLQWNIIFWITWRTIACVNSQTLWLYQQYLPKDPRSQNDSMCGWGSLEALYPAQELKAIKCYWERKSRFSLGP